MMEIFMWIVGAMLLLLVGIVLWRATRTLSPSQLIKVQEWLLYAVSEAEQMLGAGTGVIKLRFVYDQFAGRFPAWVSRLSFEVFCKLVQVALERMKSEMVKNCNVKSLIEGDPK